MKRILVIDDSTAIRGAIRRILERLSYSVDEAANGQIALERVVSQPFDAVLCDIDMPVMDGLTFVKTLRDMQDAPQPPIVMCSTHSSFERIAEALSRGANEYIMKPFDADIIENKLAACGVS